MSRTELGWPAAYPARVRRFLELYRPADGLFFGRRISVPIGALIGAALVNTGVTPNTVSMAGLLLHALVAVLVALAPTPIPVATWLAVLILWQVSFGIDCADGQLARATGRTSAFGAWLDLSIDVITHLLVYTSLLFFLVRAVALDGVAATALTSVVIGLHLFQFMSSTVHVIVGTDPAIVNPPRWLAVGMLARHALDYGLFLFLAAVLLPFPDVLLAFLVLSAVLHGLSSLTQVALNWHRYRRDRDRAGSKRG